MLKDLNTQDDKYDDENDVSPKPRPSHPRVTSVTANAANKHFFEAAQSSKSSPQIHIYEGSHHTATVRASQEHTPMGRESKPAVVSASNCQIIKDTIDGPKAVDTKKSTTPQNLQVYNQPLFLKSKSEVKKEEAMKQKKQQDRQRDADIEERVRSQQLINRVSSSDGFGKSKEVDALMSRVSGATKTALIKSSDLVLETAAHNKKILRKYDMQSYDYDNGYAECVDNVPPKKPKKQQTQKQKQTVTKNQNDRATNLSPGHRSRSPQQRQQQRQQGLPSSSGGRDRDRPLSGFLPPVQSSAPREEHGGCRVDAACPPCDDFLVY